MEPQVCERGLVTLKKGRNEPKRNITVIHQLHSTAYNGHFNDRRQKQHPLFILPNTSATNTQDTKKGGEGGIRLYGQQQTPRTNMHTQEQKQVPRYDSPAIIIVPAVQFSQTNKELKNKIDTPRLSATTPPLSKVTAAFAFQDKSHQFFPA